MALRAPRSALVAERRPASRARPGRGAPARARLRGVPHRPALVDGDLPMARLPVVPGHEIVGTVEASARVSTRCASASASACRGSAAPAAAAATASKAENLCDAPLFTGCTRDGGFATHCVADARSASRSTAWRWTTFDAAPLLCAGLIGWRALRRAGGDARVLGLYGFGAAAHLIAQVAVAQGRRVSRSRAAATGGAAPRARARLRPGPARRTRRRPSRSTRRSCSRRSANWCPPRWRRCARAAASSAAAST